MGDECGLDLTACLERIGCTEPLVVGRESLETLHYRHVTSVPFENIERRTLSSHDEILNVLERHFDLPVERTWRFKSVDV